MAQQGNQSRALVVRSRVGAPLPADVYETAGGEAYVLEIPVPGLTPEQITIEVTPEMVTVSTRPQEEPSDSDRRYLQREQPAQPMSRVFEFSEEIDTDNVRATLESGVLKIHAPKAAAGRRRVIKVA